MDGICSIMISSRYQLLLEIFKFTIKTSIAALYITYTYLPAITNEICLIYRMERRIICVGIMIQNFWKSVKREVVYIFEVKFLCILHGVN